MYSQSVSGQITTTTNPFLYHIYIDSYRENIKNYDMHYENE